MRVLDLFSGIGGISLGLHRAGMTTSAFCEINPYCRRVLSRHFPGVPIYDDVRTLTAARLRADGVVFDLIAGGFPCQDVSVAGRGIGLSGERSGLWFEFHRLIGETRPAWCFIENVPALRSRGLDQLLGGLAALGYDAEWDCVPASALGARHRRDRLWLVAYRDGGQRVEPFDALRAGRDAAGGGGEDVADALRHGPQGGEPSGSPAGIGRRIADPSAAHVAHPDRLCGPHGPLHTDEGARRRNAGGGSVGPDVAHPTEPGLPLPAGEVVRGSWRWREGRAASDGGGRCAVSDLGGMADGLPPGLDRRRVTLPQSASIWDAEPDIPRVLRGVPNRVPRLRALGNAVVPQIPEMVGRWIMAGAYGGEP